MLPTNNGSIIYCFVILGICDCCDGSDETTGQRVHCHNTCQSQALQEKEKLKGLQSLFNQGYQRRSQLIQKVKYDYEKDAAELPTIVGR